MEEWLEERKLHHDDYKSTQTQDLPSQSASTSDFDLIPAFPNEITQGPLMACLPWYMKPQLMTLNKAWALTLNNPLYTSPHYKPYALKNSVIFYAHTSTGNDHRLALHIYQEGILRKLPLPPHIPVKSYKFTRFGITDQCVYSLTPASDQGKNMYSLNKLDLGGGIIQWQTLPPLPITGKSVHILSSVSDDGKSTRDYIWIFDSAMPFRIREHRHLYTGERHSMAKENNWYALELHTATTRDGQHHSIPPPPPVPPVEKFSIHLPKYLDIYDTDKFRSRHLYKLFTVSECPLWVNYDNFIESHGHMILSTTQPRCLFVFQDDYDNCVIRGVHRICKKVNSDGSVKFLLYKRDLQNAEILEGEELNEFYESWGYFLGVFPPQQMRAVKFTADLSQTTDGWQQQFSLPSSKADDLVLNEGSTIKVAQQGTIYIYLYCAILQGKDEIPIT